MHPSIDHFAFHALTYSNVYALSNKEFENMKGMMTEHAARLVSTATIFNLHHLNLRCYDHPDAVPFFVWMPQRDA